MNAALLMLSSAWMAGADTAPTDPAAPLAVPAAPIYVQMPEGGAKQTPSQPAPPAPAAGSSSCGSCAAACDSCDHGRAGPLSRMRGLFGRKKDGDCCEPACKPAPVEHCKPECKPAPAPACDTCDSGRGGLFGRLRARGKKSDCAEPACDACHGTARVHDTVVPAPPVKSPEPIKDAPKRMPDKVLAPGLLPPAELAPTINPMPIIETARPTSPF